MWLLWFPYWRCPSNKWGWKLRSASERLISDRVLRRASTLTLSVSSDSFQLSSKLLSVTLQPEGSRQECENVCNPLQKAVLEREELVVGVLVGFRYTTWPEVCGMGLLNISFQKHGHWSAALATSALLGRLAKILEPGCRVFVGLDAGAGPSVLARSRRSTSSERCPMGFRSRLRPVLAQQNLFVWIRLCAWGYCHAETGSKLLRTVGAKLEIPPVWIMMESRVTLL